MDEVVFREATALGLGRLAADLARVARPSIRIKAQAVEDGALPLGASRFGGMPDLPPGRDWPAHRGVALPFLGQINLAEVAPYDALHRLPPAGLLYFFFNMEQHILSNARDRGSWRVLHLADAATSLVRLPVPETIQQPGEYNVVPPGGVFRPCALSFAREITVPPYYDDQYDYMRLGIPAPLSGQEQDTLDQLIATLADLPEERCPVHRLFGYESQVQLESVVESVRTLAAPEVEASAAEWRLLLQVDSDYEGPDFGWADGGTMWFFVRATDLSLGRCDRTWLYWECG